MQIPQNLMAWMLIVFSLVTGIESCRALEPDGDYLSDRLADRIVSTTQGWGKLGLNTAVEPAGRPAMPLQIKDHKYLHGLGHHAPGEIVIDLDGRFETFKSDVGIQWQGGQGTGSVVFQVFVDDKKTFDSGTVRESDPPRNVSISVRAAQELRLVVTDAGDGITCDCADWADARLIGDPGARPVPTTAVDIAPFGRVMSWDPKAKSGTSASRIQEFPRADLCRATRSCRSPMAACSSLNGMAPAASACNGLRTDRCGKRPWSSPTKRACRRRTRSNSKPGPVNPPGKGAGCLSRRGPSGPVSV